MMPWNPDEDALDDPRISQCGRRRTDNHGSKQAQRNQEETAHPVPDRRTPGIGRAAT
jgi:hypothetical protein